MPTERLDIVVSERGAAKAEKQIDRIGGAADKLHSALLRLASVAVLDRLARSFLRVAEAAIDTQNRLRTLSAGTANLERLQKRLNDVAGETRTAFADVVQLYQRSEGALRRLGKSESDVLRFVKAFNQEVKLSGASTQEASNATRQFAQGLGSGALRGEELNSILENLPTVADRIADSLGVTRGELRQLGADGKLTADVLFDAFANAEEQIGERFANSIAKPSEALQRLSDRFTQYVGQIDQALGITQRFTDGILVLSNNLDTVLSDAFTIATTASLLFIRTLGGAAFRFAPLAILLFTLRDIDSELRRLTGGSAGLGTVAHLVATGLRDMGRALRDFIRPLTDLIQKLTELESVVQLLDAYALQQSVDPIEARREALKKVLGSQQLADLQKAGEVPADITLQELERRLNEKQAPFYRPNDLFINGAPIQTDLMKVLKQEYKNATTNLIADTITELRNATGTESPVAAGLQQFAEEEAALQRKLALQNEIKTILNSIVELADKAGTSQSQVAEKIAQTVQGINASLDSIDPGEGLENYKRLLESIKPSLEEIQKTGALSNQTEALKGTIDQALQQLEDLKSKTSKLREDERAKALEQINQVGTEAHDLMLTATEQTAAAMTNVYSNVLAQLRAVAGAATAAAGGAGFAAPGVDLSQTGRPDYDTGAATGQASQQIQRVNDQLLQMQDQLFRLQAGGVQAFQTMGNAAQSFGGQTQNIGTQINNVFTNAFSSLEQALVSFVQTGKIDFKSLINAMLADLARLLIRMLIIQPLMGFFGGIFGGFGFGFSRGGLVGGFGGDPFSFGLAGFAKGGAVNGDLKSSLKRLPGYASGGGIVSGFGGSQSDTMLARLSAGEFVVRASSAGPNMQALSYLNRTGSLPRSTAGGSTVVVNNYFTNNFAGGAGAGGQQAADAQASNDRLAGQIRQTVVEVLRQEQRPGGVLSSQQVR